MILFFAGIAFAQTGKTTKKPGTKNSLITEVGIPALKTHHSTTTKTPKSNFTEYEEKTGKGKSKPKH